MKIIKFLALVLLSVSVSMSVLPAAEQTTQPQEECSSCTLSKIGRFAMLYLPNVLADALDIVTAELSFGNTAAAGVHVTKFAALTLETSDAYFVGTATGHRYGAGRREAQQVAALCWSYDNTYVSQTCGNFPSYSLHDDNFDLVEYYADAYQDDDVDLWAIGARAALFAGVALDVHLKEIPDFLCSLIGIDLAGDNWK